MKKPAAPAAGDLMVNHERQHNETGNKTNIAQCTYFFFPALLNCLECTNQSQIIVKKETVIVCRCSCLSRIPKMHLNWINYTVQLQSKISHVSWKLS